MHSASVTTWNEFMHIQRRHEILINSLEQLDVSRMLLITCKNWENGDALSSILQRGALVILDMGAEV